MGILTWRNIARAVEVWKDEGLASLIYKFKKLSKQKVFMKNGFNRMKLIF